VPDYEELQTRLDDIADTVEWASGWLEYIGENELRIGVSDRELLKADAERLRLVADALVPGRVRDPNSGRRWYLAPDEAGPREQDLLRSLATADREVEATASRLQQERADDAREQEEREQRRERDSERRRLQQRRERDQVTAFLREHGPSTLKAIVEGTKLTSFGAEQAAKAIAKRGKDQRFTLTE
jgi:hypothetical protein